MATIENQIDQLYKHATDDTSGSKRCAGILLSLWDGNTYHADLQDVLALDVEQFDAFQVILKHFYTNNTQLDQFVSEGQMKAVIAQWGTAFVV